MYISNDNNCSFSINHYHKLQVATKYINNISEDHNYDNVWGKIEFLDTLVDVTRNLYNCYVWQRLLNDSLVKKKEYTPLQLHNPYTLSSHTWVDESDLIDDDDLFFISAQTDHAVIKTIERKHELNLLGNIKELVQFQYFIDVVYNIRPKCLFEAFQKSAIYDILFYRITTAIACGNVALKNFLWGMSEMFFGFAVTELDHAIKMYTKKHTIYVVMRGLGKTTIQKEIAAAAMLCLRDIKILMIAQSKAMVTCSMNDVRDIILRYHDKDANRMFTPLDCINIYFNIDKRASRGGTGDDGNTTNAKSDAAIIKSNLFSYSNKLECVSSKKDSSLRGKNPNFVLEDEFIVLENHPTIIALAQRCHCQINYFSSPVYHKPEMYVNIIVDLNNSDDTNLYRMMYFCMLKEHIKFSTTQQACINLWFYMPKHLVYSSDNRLITDVMSSGSKQNENALPYYITGPRPSAYCNELGVVKRSDIEMAMQKREQAAKFDGDDASTSTTFGPAFFEYMRNVKGYRDIHSVDFKTKNKAILRRAYHFAKDRQNNAALLDHLDFFVYVDPCYNSGTQSAIAICCCIKPLDTSEKCLVTYLNHYFLTDNDLSLVHEKIGEMMLDCVLEMNKIFKDQNKWCNFFVAVENNSQQSAVALIHQQLENIVLNYQKKVRFSIYAFVTLKMAQNRRIQGYNLGKEKSDVFRAIIGFLNHLGVQFSRIIGVSLTQHITSSSGEKRHQTIIEHLLEECNYFRYDSQKRSYTGKTERTGSDDLVVALVMAIFLAKNYSDTIYNYKYAGAVKYPWIKLTGVRTTT